MKMRRGLAAWVNNFTLCHSESNIIFLLTFDLSALKIETIQIFNLLFSRPDSHATELRN